MSILSKLNEKRNYSEIAKFNESTNALIAIQHKGKEGEIAKVTFIYLHWDGYKDGAGKTLLNSYKTAKKVKDLIKLGDLSILGKNLGSKVDFDDRSTHKKDQCIAYGRDRGEKNVKPQTVKGLSQIDYQEYTYVFVESRSEWIYSDDGGDTWKFLSTDKQVGAPSEGPVIHASIHLSGKKVAGEVWFTTRKELDSWLDKEFK